MPIPQKPPQKRLSVGLALGGGIARGLFHIGVLSVFEREGIPIDVVSGTSAGAIVGGIYCAGLGIDRLREIGLQIRWRDIVSLGWSWNGLLCFKKMEQYLIELLGDLTFADLERPLVIVAADLDTGQPVFIEQGRVALAIRASCSIPGLFAPVLLEGRSLGDGSISHNLPVHILRQKGADYVIGVELFQSAQGKRWKQLERGLGMFEILLRQSGGGLQQVDYRITYAFSRPTYLFFSHSAELIALGEKVAMDSLETIRSALDSSTMKTNQT